MGPGLLRLRWGTIVPWYKLQAGDFAASNWRQTRRRVRSLGTMVPKADGNAFAGELGSNCSQLFYNFDAYHGMQPAGGNLGSQSPRPAMPRQLV